MKQSKILIMAMVFAMVVSACGAKAEPTIDPADVQNTAIAAAFTVVAQTQAAVPTDTPVPPTDTPTATPLPTETPLPLPTTDANAAVPSATSAAVSGGGDPCNAPLPGDVAGKPTRIKLVNKTKGDLVVSLYLNLTPFGECGYRGYTLGNGDSTVIEDLPQGCYNVSVFVNNSKGSSTKAFGYGCINNPDTWTFEINAENVKFIGP